MRTECTCSEMELRDGDGHTIGCPLYIEPPEPTITVTESDARVAAMRQAAAELPEKIYPIDSVFGLLKQSILAIPANDAALESVKMERDNLWINAFHAEDLQPRVTPESLADWVFRDVEQQLDGLKREKAALRVIVARARVHEARTWLGMIDADLGPKYPWNKYAAKLEAELAAAEADLAKR